MLALFIASLGSPQVALREGLTITHSCEVKPGWYGIEPAENQRIDRPTVGVVHIRGQGVTVDFRGATLSGSPESVEPDKRAGVGIDVAGANIVIKNAHIRGYKVGLLARHAPHLKLIDCDFSYNYKQHLGSTLEREDESDWQSYHHNEADEWLRYGAGAYIEDSNGFEVRGCRATGGQCGVMLVRSNKGKVWNCDCSFLSGVGLGLYRSSDNVVEHNKFDWCVRGFSYGVYNRGQDSAGILVFEQCDDNKFAYNSVTHGGDGFFLWAGQHTMDTGQGGCNGNVLYGNDFSHAVANGIEATFSTNTFAHNLLVECDYGIWGGYSYDTVSVDNYVAACRIGMAFEHSQDCMFSENDFVRCKEGIELWGGGKPDPTWEYAKKRDVRSLKNLIDFNKFADVPGAAISLRDTVQTGLQENTSYGPTKGLVADAASGTFPNNALTAGGHEIQPLDWSQDREYPGDISELVDGWDPYHSNPFNAYRISPLKGGTGPFLPEGALRGRRYILVDQWGPYDFRYPRLWPRGEDKQGDRVFEVLGPKGKWSVKDVQGCKVVGADSGDVPGFLTIKPATTSATDIHVAAVFTGAEATDYRGIVAKADVPITFGYSEFFAPLDWRIKFFKWDQATDPRTAPEAFAKLLGGTPFATAESNKLDFVGYGDWAKGLGNNHFAIGADAEFKPEKAGSFMLDVLTDDGCRVDLDGKPLQLLDDHGKPSDAFKYQGPTHYIARLDLTAGPHKLHVEYFQIDGYKTLQVQIKPAP